VLVIRAGQMQILEDSSRERFETEMAAHARAFSPRLCEVIGDDQLRHVIRDTVRRAEGYGFSNRGPIRLFIELTFLCGSAFDTDPQYAPLGRSLREKAGQMYRAQEMHEWHNEYLERVSGPGAINVHLALRALLAFARGPLAMDANVREDLRRELVRMFPAKAAFSGEAALTAIIDESIDDSRPLGFENTRPVVLLAALKFAFGHGCLRDPLYPWISQTLDDPRIVSPAARAERLEKKAITWLKHVVARNDASPA
jgi:hypothetical protein